MTSTLRVAVIGAGTFGEQHLRIYDELPDVTLVAVVDQDAARARTLALRHGVSDSFTDCTEMLERCHPDALSIVTPDTTHVPLAIQALDAGCAVLLEKPVAATTAELLDLHKAAHVGIVVPGHVLRLATPYVQLREYVRGGDLGTVLGLAAGRDRSRDHRKRYADSHVFSLTAIHDIDLAIWLTRARAKQVSALAIDHDDGTGSSLGFIQVAADDGSAWSFRSSWLLPEESGPADRLEVYGTQGHASVELTPSGTRLRLGPIANTDMPVEQVHAAALRAEIAHFCECARRGRPSEIMSLVEASHAVAIAEAARQSAARRGEPVDL